MRCPRCKQDNNTVYDGKQAERVYKRRRKCNVCGYRFKTIEYYSPFSSRNSGRKAMEG